MLSSLAAATKPKKYQRKQTQEQKQKQAQKYSATCAKKRAAKEAAEADLVQRKRQKEENKRVNFFSGNKLKAVVNSNSESIATPNDHVNETSDERFADVTVTTDDDVLVVDNPPMPTELYTEDVLNNLDFNDEDDEWRPSSMISCHISGRPL